MIFVVSLIMALHIYNIFKGEKENEKTDYDYFSSINLCDSSL